MTKEFSLIELENDYILNPPSFTRYRPGLYPSSASVKYMDGEKEVVRGACLRSNYYQALKYPKEPSSVYLNQTAFVGKVVEEAIIDRWKRMGIYVANNFKFFDKNYILSGEGDAVIKNPNTGSYIGMEIKSYYGQKAERDITGVRCEQKTKRFFYGKPKDYQFLQSVLYAWEYRDVLPEYRLYYFERGTGNRFEFEIGLDRNDPTKPCWWRQIPGANWKMFSSDPVIQKFSVQDIYDRYKKLIKYCQKKEVPSKDYNTIMSLENIEYGYKLGEVAHGKYTNWKEHPEKPRFQIEDWHCNYCFYKEQCKKDGE